MNYTGKTAITFGVFDLLHYGHFELFRRIRDLVGETGKVYIMLQVDEWVSKYKDVRLVYNFAQRKKMIDTLRIKIYNRSILDYILDNKSVAFGKIYNKGYISFPLR